MNNREKKYFDDINLDEILDPIFEKYADDNLKKIRNTDSLTTEYKNKLYKLYSNINIYEIKKVAKYYSKIVKNIIKKYTEINIINIKNMSATELEMLEKRFDDIFLEIENLNNLIDNELHVLIKENSVFKIKYDYNYIKNIPLESNAIANLINEYEKAIKINGNIRKSIYEKYLFVKKLNDFYKKILDIVSHLEDQSEEESIINNIINDYYEILDPIDLNDLHNNDKKLYNIVNKIWNSVVNKSLLINNGGYCYLCSNNQFLDPKQEAILLTDKTINCINLFPGFELGFILSFNNNIMYSTYKKNIMDEENPVKNYKTPKEIERDLIINKRQTRLSLDGFNTKVIAVYYIDGCDEVVVAKAKEFSSTYKLPLIKIKK